MLPRCSVNFVVANACLRERRASSHSVEQSVEWLYAFDIHCNAFFAYFLVAYVLHYVLLPLALGHSFIALLVANATQVASVGAYFYVTHLGFRSLPFLRNTEVFLYPVVAAVLGLVVSIGLAVVGLKFNFSRILFAALLAPLTPIA